MTAASVNFDFERETKNTARYQEDVRGAEPIVGTIYVHKTALKVMGDGKLPERLTVTIEAK